MDFHDDHTAFDTTAATTTDEVSHMYVPHADDHGLGDDGTGGHDSGTDSDDGGTETTGDHGSGHGETVSIEVGNDEVTADATIDIDHDGTNDTAVVQDAAGEHIAITDLDGDGDADHAALLDESGHVMDTAHLNEDGSWVQDGPGDTNPYGAVGSTLGGADGASADSGSDSDSDSGSSASADGDGSAGSPGATPGGTPGDTIVVDSHGQSMEAQATVDADHDGTKDTAVVRTPDGNQVAFTDHYDESSGTWVEGAADGSGEPGTSTAGVGDTGGLGAGASGHTDDGAHTGGIGTSPAGDTGTGQGEQIEVTVGGHTGEVNADYDLDNDGRDETAVVAGPDGTRIAFSDTDGDGDADKAAVYDASGNLVGTATYNEGSGTWIQD
jgi:hypothetical protein